MARGTTTTTRACLMALTVGMLVLQLLVKGAHSASAHAPVTHMRRPGRRLRRHRAAPERVPPLPAARPVPRGGVRARRHRARGRVPVAGPGRGPGCRADGRRRMRGPRTASRDGRPTPSPSYSRSSAAESARGQEQFPRVFGAPSCPPPVTLRTCRTTRPARGALEVCAREAFGTAAGLRRVSRRVPGRPAAVRGRGRGVRRPGRTGPRHRHRGRSGGRLHARQQSSGERARGRAHRARVRGRAGVRPAGARRHRARHGAAPAPHGQPAPGPLVPGDLRGGRRGHARRDRPRPDRRAALRDGKHPGARVGHRQTRRAARPVDRLGHLTEGAHRARHRRGHDRRAARLEAAAQGGQGGARTARRGGARDARCRRVRAAGRAGRGAGSDRVRTAARRRRVRAARERRGRRHRPRVHPHRVGREPVQRGRRRPDARRAAHLVRQGTHRAGQPTAPCAGCSARCR